MSSPTTKNPESSFVTETVGIIHQNKSKKLEKKSSTPPLEIREESIRLATNLEKYIDEQLPKKFARLEADATTKFAKNGVVDWNSPEVIEFLYRNLGIERSKGSQFSRVGKVKKQFSKIFGADPFDRDGKAYISTKMADNLKFHDFVNNSAAFLATIVGMDLGKAMGTSILENFSKAGMDQATENTVGLGLTAGIFGIATRFNEWYLDSADLSHHSGVIKKTTAIGVVLLLKASILGGSAIGAAMNLKPMEIAQYTQRQVDNRVKDLENKAMERESNFGYAVNLAKQKLKLQGLDSRTPQQEQELNELQSKLQNASATAEVYATAKEQSGQGNKVAELETRIAKLKSRIEELQNQKRNRSLIMDLTKVDGTNRDKGLAEYDAQIKDVNLQIQAAERKLMGFSSDMSRFTEAQEDMANMSPEAWLVKYSDRTIDPSKVDMFLKLARTTNPDDLNLQEKFQIIVDQSDYTNRHGLVNNIIAKGFFAFLPEIMGLCTLGMILMSEEYALYSNRKFQDQYKALVKVIYAKVSASQAGQLPSEQVFKDMIEDLARQGSVHLPLHQIVGHIERNRL
jgi:hypothetical protein